MRYAIYQQNDGVRWVLLMDGAWASPSAAYLTPRAPYFHVVKTFDTKRAAKKYAGSRTGITIEPWVAADREDASHER